MPCSTLVLCRDPAPSVFVLPRYSPPSADTDRRAPPVPSSPHMSDHRPLHTCLSTGPHNQCAWCIMHKVPGAHPRRPPMHPHNKRCSRPRRETLSAPCDPLSLLLHLSVCQSAVSAPSQQMNAPPKLRRAPPHTMSSIPVSCLFCPALPCHCVSQQVSVTSPSGSTHMIRTVYSRFIVYLYGSRYL